MKHTNQTFFNAVWERAKDKRRSMLGNRDSLPRCAYRGPEGLRCFVGVCIPDDEYKAEFERLFTSEVLQSVPSLVGVDMRLIAKAQSIHDHSPEWSWESYLRELAEEYGLEVPA